MLKTYHPPELTLKVLTGSQDLAALSQWLKDSGLENAGITTYTISS